MTFRLIIADNLKVPSLSTCIRHVLRLAGNTRCVACGFATVEHSCISYSAIGKGRTVVRQQYTGLIALDIGCRELPIDKLHVHIRIAVECPGIGACAQRSGPVVSGGSRTNDQLIPLHGIQINLTVILNHRYRNLARNHGSVISISPSRAVPFSPRVFNIRSTC